jgi:hypothetical protein
MDLGIGSYDRPPPDRLDDGDLERLVAQDRFRFANRLAAWVEVVDGRIVDAGYGGGALVGDTVVRLGAQVRIPAVSFPLIQHPPDVTDVRARFVQTAGGRTGAPLPRRIDRPPWVRLTAPTAWTTLELVIHADGRTQFGMPGASPFPRHWVYGPDGELARKSAVIDFSEWTRVHDHVRTPWHDHERAALMSEVESQVERDLAKDLMKTRPPLVTVRPGEELITEGLPGSSVYLILDGVLSVSVQGREIAELGPGAIVGERALLEEGVSTATVVARTECRAAVIDPGLIDRSSLEAIAQGHRREEN